MIQIITHNTKYRPVYIEISKLVFLCLLNEMLIKYDYKQITILPHYLQMICISNCHKIEVYLVNKFIPNNTIEYSN